MVHLPQADQRCGRTRKARPSRREGPDRPRCVARRDDVGVYRAGPVGRWRLGFVPPLAEEPRTPPVPWLVSPNTVESARFSPDSRWLAYVSDESGQNEVYVRPVDVSEESLRWQISSDGGSDPGWSRDGDRMLYRSRSDWLISSPGLARRPTPAFGAGAIVRDACWRHELSSERLRRRSRWQDPHGVGDGDQQQHDSRPERLEQGLNT